MLYTISLFIFKKSKVTWQTNKTKQQTKIAALSDCDTVVVLLFSYFTFPVNTQVIFSVASDSNMCGNRLQLYCMAGLCHTVCGLLSKRTSAWLNSFSLTKTIAAIRRRGRMTHLSFSAWLSIAMIH